MQKGANLCRSRDWEECERHLAWFERAHGPARAKLKAIEGRAARSRRTRDLRDKAVLELNG